jgi:hypothetical protein
MENIIKAEDLTNSEIVKFNITDAFLTELKAKFLPLKIIDVNDQAGYDKMKEAKKLVQSKRTEVEKKRKELKEDYFRTGQAIDKEAKRITTIIVEVESYLDCELKTIDDEKARLKLEKENLERLPIRKMTLAEMGMELPDSQILSMNIMAWSVYVMNEKERIMMEQKAKLDAQQAEFNKKQADIDLQNKIEEAKRQAVIDADNKFRRELREIKERQDAREFKMKADQEAKDRKAKEDQQAKEKQELADRIKAERKAQRAPDKVKLMEFANAIEKLARPSLKSEEAYELLSNVNDLLKKVVAYINKNIQDLD